jgi:2'-5' RNA ligase
MTFKVKGYGTFDGTRVVFVDIEPDESLDRFRWELSKKLRQYCNLTRFDLERKFYFHATLAMKLGPRKFEKIKKYIETQPESESTHHVMRVTREDRD